MWRRRNSATSPKRREPVATVRLQVVNSAPWKIHVAHSLAAFDAILRRLAPGEASAVVRRFPLPAACALGATIVAIATDEGVPFAVHDEAGRLLALLLLGLIATLATATWAEARGAAWRVHGPIAAAVLGLLAARLYTTPLENSIAALILAPIVVLGAATAPFVGRPGASEAFWTFNRGAWLAALFGGFVAVVLGLGLTLAYAALDELLDIDLGGEAYGHTWTICLALVWPLVGLGNAPRIAALTDRAEAGKLVAVLVGYVLVPVVAIYLVILYLYVGRIVVTWSLPSGEAAPIIWGCAAIAVITHVLAYPLRESGINVVRLYHRHAFRALSVPVVVLAVAVWVRIDAYGFTEQRYVLALGTAALLVHALLGVAWPARRLVQAPAALCALLILGSFGPWGAIAVSTRSQVGILRDLLGREGILVEGRIVAASPSPAPEIAQRIGSVVAYLVESGKAEVIAPWFPEGTFGDPASPTWVEALKAMGVSYVADWQDPGDVNFWSRPDAPIDVAGFALAVPFQMHNQAESPLTWPGVDPPRMIFVSVADWAVTVASGADRVVLDVETVVPRARATMNADGAAAPLIVEGSSGSLRARLVMQTLNATTLEGKLVPSWSQGTLLVGEIGP